MCIEWWRVPYGTQTMRQTQRGICLLWAKAAHTSEEHWQKIYMLRLQTPQRESKLQRVRSLVYLRGLIERVHMYEYFTASFYARGGSEIQSAACDGEIHCVFPVTEVRVWPKQSPFPECPWKFENILLWMRNKVFDGTCTVRNRIEGSKIKDTVNGI